MKIRKGFALKEIAGDKVIMPVGDNINQYEGAVILNEVAAFIYEEIEACATINGGAGITFQELLKAVLEQYEVDEETATADLKETLKDLMECKVIEE